jgi:hypothetical protein
VYYTPATLGRLLRECGFTIARVHPALLHRTATLPARLAACAFAPLRAFAQTVANHLHLRKEFWTVAIRD